MTHNNIRLTKDEQKFLGEFLGERLRDPAYDPQMSVERAIMELNERRRDREAEFRAFHAETRTTAGPFSAEQAAINQVWTFRDKEVNRTQDARVQALSFAVQVRDSCDSAEATVEDAEKFYKFLSDRS